MSCLSSWANNVSSIITYPIIRSLGKSRSLIFDIYSSCSNYFHSKTWKIKTWTFIPLFLTTKYFLIGQNPQNQIKKIKVSVYPIQHQRRWKSSSLSFSLKNESINIKIKVFGGQKSITQEFFLSLKFLTLDNFFSTLSRLGD